MMIFPELKDAKIADGYLVVLDKTGMQAILQVELTGYVDMEQRCFSYIKNLYDIGDISDSEYKSLEPTAICDKNEPDTVLAISFRTSTGKQWDFVLAPRHLLPKDSTSFPSVTLH